MTDTSTRTMGRKMTIGNGGTSALMAGVAGFGLGMMVSAGRKAASQAATFAAGDWFEGLKAEHQAARTLLEQLAATREEDVAKRAALVRMRNYSALRYMLPWLPDEIDEMERVFGDDQWSYGVEANRSTFETMMKFMVQQDMLKKAPTVEELFVKVD